MIITDNFKDIPNRALYQRLKMFSGYYDVHVIAKDTLPLYFLNRISSFEKFETKGYFKLFIIPFILLKIFYYKRNFGIKVIYTSRAPLSILIGFIAKNMLGMIWIHDLYDHPKLEVTLNITNLLTKYLALLSTKLVKYSNIFILDMHESILKALPFIEKNKIIKTTNGVDLELLQEKCFRDKEDDFRTREVLITYVGLINKERGIEVIIDSLSILEKMGIKAKLSLIGRVVDSNLNLNSLIENNENQSRFTSIEYLGEIKHSEVIEHLVRQDIGLVILDTQIDNYVSAYPNKLFEYLACGLITIASETKAIQEILVDGFNGFLIKEMSVEHLSKKFEQIIDMENNKLEKIRNNAINTSQKYDWQKINQRLIQDISKLLTIYL